MIFLTHISPLGRHPLPPPLQLPVRADQQAEAGADRGVEPVPGLRGPRPRRQRVKQWRDRVQVSPDIMLA